MKICYLHQYFCTPEMAGGTRSYEFARRLVRDGHEVHVLTSRTDTVAPRGWVVEGYEGITVHWYGNPYNNKMRPGQRVWSFLRFSMASTARALRVNSQVNLATSTPLTIAIPAMVVRATRRTPYVFEVRDLWPEMPIAVGVLRHPVLIWMARFLERQAYRHASRIIALSPGMADGVIRVDARPAVVTTIPNSCDPSMHEARPEAIADIRACRDWLGDRPLVVYAGTLGKLNNVGYLAQLARAVMDVDSEIRFLVVGDGAESDRIRSFASDMGVLGRNFFMEPSMPKSSIPALMGAADLACALFAPIPQMEINSSNKFFDALASGTPVLINYGGWHRDLLKASGAGLALEGQYPGPEQAREVVALLRDPEASTYAAEEALALSAQFDRELLYERFESTLLTASGVGGE